LGATRRIVINRALRSTSFARVKLRVAPRKNLSAARGLEQTLVCDWHGSAVGFVTVSTSMTRKVIARDLAVRRR
jgi:hypothetical protein